MADLKKDKETKELEKLEQIEERSKLQTIEESEQRKIVEMVIQDIETEEARRSEWSNIRGEYIKLYKGIREPKSLPWTNCSNITTMATATHTKLIHAKLFPTVWNEKLVYWRPQEREDIQHVEKIRKFMSWVIRQELKLQNTIDDLVADAVVDGTVVRKIRWQIMYRWVMGEGGPEYERFEKAIIDKVDLEDFYMASDDIQNCEYIAQNLYYTLPDLKEEAARGHFINVNEKLEPGMIELYMPEGKRTKMGDEEVLVADTQMRNKPIRVIEWYGKYDINNDDIREECVFWVAKETKTFMGAKLLIDISKVNERPYIIGHIMKLGDRKYGVGVPELMRGLAKELDAIHNQRIDAGNIAIAPFFFFRSGSSLKPEEVKIAPGVGVPVDDVRDVQLAQFPTSNLAVSFQEERIIIEFIEKLTNASAYQMGRESDIVKTRATATGTLSLIAQGEQAFMILGMRCQNIVGRLLTMILHFYQQFMPPGLAERVLGEEAGELLFPEGLAPSTISGNYDAYLVLDSSAGNKLMERESALAIMQTLMPITQDPVLQWEMKADFLKAMGKVDVERYIGDKPQPQQGGQVGPGQEPAGGPGAQLTQARGMAPAQEMGIPGGAVSPPGR